MQTFPYRQVHCTHCLRKVFEQQLQHHVRHFACCCRGTAFCWLPVLLLFAAAATVAVLVAAAAATTAATAAAATTAA
jgi:hypothetical protein